jgi:hypothetical protein
MTEALTRDEVIRKIVIDRAELLSAVQVIDLVDHLPVDIELAIKDFSATVELSPVEQKLLIKHNVSVAWELLEFAQEKQLYGPNFKVGKPPRN